MNLDLVSIEAVTILSQNEWSLPQRKCIDHSPNNFELTQEKGAK